MFSTLVRRTAQKADPIPYIYTNTFKARRLWPPDFSKINPKHQFRLERKYKRRAKLKWARPRWTKAVKIVQMGSILCGYSVGCWEGLVLMLIVITVYGVLFLDWNNAAQGSSEHKPFEGVCWRSVGIEWALLTCSRSDRGFSA